MTEHNYGGGSFCHTFTETTFSYESRCVKYICAIETVLTETIHSYANTLIHSTCVHNSYSECTEWIK